MEILIGICIHQTANNDTPISDTYTNDAPIRYQIMGKSCRTHTELMFIFDNGNTITTSTIKTVKSNGLLDKNYIEKIEKKLMFGLEFCWRCYLWTFAEFVRLCGVFINCDSAEMCDFLNFSLLFTHTLYISYVRA